MFSLTESNASSLKVQEDVTVFYCRTFTFTVNEFLDLVQMLLDEHQDSIPTQLYEWDHYASILNVGADDDVPIHIRYIGQTTRTAWSRYKADLLLHVQGLHRSFIEICQNEFPEVLASAEVEEFDRGSIEMLLRCSKQRLANVREQALIALFGPSTLLNSSIGGFGAAFEFNEIDDREFLAFKTKGVQYLEQNATSISPLEELRQYGQLIQDHATKNPESTNSANYPITDNVRDMMVNQSVAAMVGRYTPLVTIGSDLGVFGQEECKPFFHGYARASALTVDCLSHFINVELGYTTTQEHQVSALQTQHFLPFVDLYPWAKKSKIDLQGAMRILRRYLQIVNPLVVLTFSEHVTGVALGGFHHANGMPRGHNMGSVTGRVLVSKYDHDAGAREHDCICLVIPCIHPGSFAHTGNNKLHMRLFAKSLAVAWLALSLATQVMARGQKTKREMCKEVIDLMKPLVGQGSDFNNTFDKLRKDYQDQRVEESRREADRVRVRRERQVERVENFAKGKKQENFLAPPENASETSSTVRKQKLSIAIDWNQSNPVVKALVARCRKALEELYLIVDCDIARGTAISDERDEQVARLTGIYKQYLNADKKPMKTLTQSLKNVKVGQLYYFSMTNTSHQAIDIKNILSFFIDDPINATSTDWLQDNTALPNASSKLRKFVMDKIISSNYRRQESLNNVGLAFQALLKTIDNNLSAYVSKLLPKESAKLTVYQSSPHKVVIRPALGHGLVHFRWIHDDDKEITIRDLMVPKATIPIVPGEERFISL